MIPQVLTLTLRTSVSVGRYLGAVIRFMFSKKLGREIRREDISESQLEANTHPALAFVSLKL